jgi:hypothetical protein
MFKKRYRSKTLTRRGREVRVSGGEVAAAAALGFHSRKLEDFTGLRMAVDSLAETIATRSHKSLLPRVSDLEQDRHVRERALSRRLERYQGMKLTMAGLLVSTDLSKPSHAESHVLTALAPSGIICNNDCGMVPSSSLQKDCNSCRVRRYHFYFSPPLPLAPLALVTKPPLP